jgi:heme oxygenase
LHRAVVGRLPLSLPPKATSPHLYALGISRFAQIYSALESAWRDQLEAAAPDGTAKDQARYCALLAEAHLPAIARSQRLESDLRNLKTEWDGGDNDDAFIPQGNDIAVREAITHVLETVRVKPYTLLAYSWIMYLALFNGGRWIRQQLLDAGPQFWYKELSGVGKPGSASSDLRKLYLSFWDFDGDQDGEDIKLAYRAGFIEASKRLTEEECDDVVCEAKALFQYCLDMVTEIDVVVALERKKRAYKQYDAVGAYSTYLVLSVLALGALLAIGGYIYRP